jgi:hypothetical protein
MVNRAYSVIKWTSDITDRSRTKELHIRVILAFDHGVENRGPVPNSVRTP